MSVAENIATVRRFYTAGPADDDTLRHSFARPDVVWHVPGDNPVSGRYEGQAAVFEAIPKAMRPLDEWTIRVDDVMGNADLVVATFHVVARRGDTKVETSGAHVFRFDDSGLVAEAWGFAGDQSGLDAVFTA
ncbi:nuclear transport factor 2 family protein [Lentzea nigeriaca]|uniref:nuclear transport factor 2 family protein n=1 Tax=Lentzea nigeriaca TaxID=1128665 RepID=UPI00195E3A98|nr:nuclear transport factor 2 family protein [Lentzea nigeriaca]MBM7858438.1 ketosteroid isomerase-like protein [Lentzea nigeriaca]